MKKADFQMISYILIAFGVCVLILGILAFGYGESYGGYYWFYPYRDFSWLLLIGGSFMLVTGLGPRWRVKQE